MQIEDFSNGFDVLCSSFSATADFGKDAPANAPVFNEHEKSVYLTKAQEELVISLYTGKNSNGDSFESSEEIRRYLSPLIKTDRLDPISTTSGLPLGVDSNSKFFTLPLDCWFITYESIDVTDSSCEGLSSIEVYPVKQDEYHRIRKNPFRGANSHRALRLDLSDGVIEIVSKYNAISYYLRYLRKLKPIILCKLDDDSAINDTTDPSECELHESLHQRVLELAVTMALQSKRTS